MKGYMRRYLTLLTVMLCGCGSFATVGEQGPPGQDGAPGEPGPPGPAGDDAVLSGDRLTARRIDGEDGSRWHPGDFVDSERGEVCRFQPIGEEWRCLPPIETATDWPFWVAPDCTGDRGSLALWKGTTVVRVLGGELDGQILARAEEVTMLYYKGPGGDEPCKPFANGGGWPAPYHRWPVLNPDDFVLGDITP